MRGRNRVILVAVLALLLCLLFYFFFIRARQAELAAVNDQIEAAENETIRLQAELQRLQDLQANAPKLQARLTKIRELVPRDNDVPNFIFLVQDAANRAGVSFLQITPELPKPPPEGAAVAEVRTAIGAKGGYFAVQDFLRRLYTLDRAVRVDNFTLAGEELDGGDTVVSMTATSRIFFELPAGATTTTTGTTGTTTTPSPSPTP